MGDYKIIKIFIFTHWKANTKNPEEIAINRVLTALAKTIGLDLVEVENNGPKLKRLSPGNSSFPHVHSSDPEAPPLILYYEHLAAHRRGKKDRDVTLSDFLISPAELSRFHKIIFRGAEGDYILKDRDGEMTPHPRPHLVATGLAQLCHRSTNAGRWKLWHYIDLSVPLHHIMSENFFLPHAYAIAHRDHIHITAADGSAIAHFLDDGNTLKLQLFASTIPVRIP